MRPSSLTLAAKLANQQQYAKTLDMSHLRSTALTGIFGFFLATCTGVLSPHPAAAQELTKDVIKVSTTIVVEEGEIFDGNGALYDWVGEGDCSQAEDMPPMFKLSAGSTLKNLKMKNAPDGIHVKGSHVIIDNIVNVDVCEDAISIKLDKNKKIPANIVISNSKFFECSDKAIQITRGDNILIEGNEFHNCARPIRLKELATNIRIENNAFYNVKSAIKVTGGNGSAAKNLIEKAEIGFWIEDDGTFEDAGENRLKNVKEPIRTTNGGRLSSVE